MNKELIYKKQLLNIHILQNEEWYQLLVSDCKATIVECISASRWILVEGYWTIGQRIREDENVKKHEKGSAEFLASLANGFIKTCISKRGWGITWNLQLDWQNFIEKNIAKRLI